MAGLRKPVKRRDATKPSTALILFLVFFIILSLGLGIWGYYGYAGQEELRNKAKAEKALAVANTGKADFMAFVAREARLAIGDTLTPDEMTSWQIDRDEFARADGKFKAEPTRDAIDKWIKENKKQLGMDESDKGYKTTYQARLAELEGELKKTKAALATTQTELKAATDKFTLISTKVDDNWKKALAAIKAGNDAALAASKAKAKESEDQFLANKDLQEKLAESELKGQDQVGKLERQVRKLETTLAVKEAEARERKDANPAGIGSDAHALILDISKGKPLWDTSLGKITRIDFQNYEVYINLGSANGIKPDVTFNVFGASHVGLPEKALKGTIEVIRIIDRGTSVARITSLFDAEGKEIVLTDTNKGRIQREAENAIKEGDLLYNMFWGTRVAIAGNINVSGLIPTTPAEQNRELDNFMFLCTRAGMTVDAHLNLADAEIKGAIVPRTRYLILGEGMYVPKNPDPKEAAGVERAKKINEQMELMRKVAADNGMFIISIDNFNAASGFRRARASLRAENFRPQLPWTGAGFFTTGPAAPKKANDAKDMEKDMN